MAYLLSLSLGPVQEFIAAALRTRDLWFGSYMLSEASKAAAKSIAENGGQLIFPAPASPTELSPDSPLNVANRIVAWLEGDEAQAAKVLDDAKRAAVSRFDTFIQQAERHFNDLVRAHLRTDHWERQRQHFLELFSCWVCIDSEYLNARRRLDRLNAARKNTREFQQSTLEPTGIGSGVPKSSLDARRESVLPKDLTERERRRLRLGAGEQLDLPGLVKRLAGGKKEQFTAVPRIASDSWLQRLNDEERLSLCDVMKPMVALDLATHVRGNQGCYAAFPYDADLLYPDRVELTLRDAKDQDSKERLRDLKKVLRPLWKRYGEPGSYYALLLADGDRMGALLDKAQNAEQHRAISSTLSTFANGVPATVRRFRGHCIYAGGDDILALLPLDKALSCADTLRRNFAQCLVGLAHELNAEAPTLSAGLALVHRLMPLGRVRAIAKEAERLAKGDTAPDPRNALGIIIQPRSGAPLQWRSSWDETPAEQLTQWAGYFGSGLLPQALPYELRNITRRFLGADRFAELLEGELRYVLMRKHERGGAAPLDQALVRSLTEHAITWGMPGLIDFLLVTRWFAAHGMGEGVSSP